MRNSSSWVEHSHQAYSEQRELPEGVRSLARGHINTHASSSSAEDMLGFLSFIPNEECST